MIGSDIVNAQSQSLWLTDATCTFQMHDFKNSDEGEFVRLDKRLEKVQAAGPASC